MQDFSAGDIGQVVAHEVCLPLCDVPDRCQDISPGVRMPAAEFIEQGVGFCVGHRGGEACLGDFKIVFHLDGDEDVLKLIHGSSLSNRIFVGLAEHGEVNGIAGNFHLNVLHGGAIGEVGGGENGGSDEGEGGDGTDDGLFHGGASFLEIKINFKSVLKVDDGLDLFVAGHGDIHGVTVNAILDVVAVKVVGEGQHPIVLGFTLPKVEIEFTRQCVVAMLIHPVHDGLPLGLVFGPDMDAVVFLGAGDVLLIAPYGQLGNKVTTVRKLADKLGDFIPGLVIWVVGFNRTRLDGFVGVLVVVDIDKLAGLVVDDMKPEIIRLGKKHRVEDTLFVVGYGRGEGVGIGKAVAETVSGQGVDHIACQVAGKFVRFALDGDGADGFGVHDMGTVVVDGDLKHGGLPFLNGKWA